VKFGQFVTLKARLHVICSDRHKSVFDKMSRKLFEIIILSFGFQIHTHIDVRIRNNKNCWKTINGTLQVISFAVNRPTHLFAKFPCHETTKGPLRSLSQAAICLLANQLKVEEIF